MSKIFLVTDCMLLSLDSPCQVASLVGKMRKTCCFSVCMRPGTDSFLSANAWTNAEVLGTLHGPIRGAYPVRQLWQFVLGIATEGRDDVVIYLDVSPLPCVHLIFYNSPKTFCFSITGCVFFFFFYLWFSSKNEFGFGINKYILILFIEHAHYSLEESLMKVLFYNGLQYICM